MKIGLIDCDNISERRNKAFFPNLSLMKISAWHKAQGDSVEWYRDKMINGHVDKVYISKVFSFSNTPEWDIDADEIVYGGSGFAIEMVDGVETYTAEKDPKLPEEIEHIYPDYELYAYAPQTHDQAYGFLTRGCPRNCEFCHASQMQGRSSRKVAELEEFWGGGQKNIMLLDPNITACKNCVELFEQLAETGAKVDFSQGLDIRLLNDEKIEALLKIKHKGSLHFAWDRYEDGPEVVPRLKRFKELTGWPRSRIMVYVLMGKESREFTDQDRERLQILREIGCDPYVMLYDKSSLKRGCDLKRVQRWVNWKPFWGKFPTYEEYRKAKV